jgi:hypothetical protein
MATKQSRALRAKQKAKAARVQKQKAYAQPRGVFGNLCHFSNMRKNRNDT